MSSVSRSATSGRRKRMCAWPGTSYGRRRNDADRNDERDRRTRDQGGAGRGLRTDGALAQRRLAVRRRPEVDLRRRAEGDDEGARRVARAGDREDGRGG